MGDSHVNHKSISTTEHSAVVEATIEALGPGSLTQPLTRSGLGAVHSDLDPATNHSLSVSGTGEFVEARPWRNRTEILQVLDSTKGPNSMRLLDDLSRRFADQGGKLILLYHRLFSSNEEIFRRAGFGFLEEIIEMSCGRPWLMDYTPDSAIEVGPESDPDKLLNIDTKTFSWLWRNSGNEMTDYLLQPGVRALAASADGRLAGYLTYTMRRDFAHIDRVAVSPDQQGRGIGKALMSWGLAEISEAGGHSVALTTQRTNTRSQNLYRRFGFAETRRGYSIYGKWL